NGSRHADPTIHRMVTGPMQYECWRKKDTDNREKDPRRANTQACWCERDPQAADSCHGDAGWPARLTSQIHRKAASSRVFFLPLLDPSSRISVAGMRGILLKLRPLASTKFVSLPTVVSLFGHLKDATRSTPRLQSQISGPSWLLNTTFRLAESS